MARGVECEFSKYDFATDVNDLTDVLVETGIVWEIPNDGGRRFKVVIPLLQRPSSMFWTALVEQLRSCCCRASTSDKDNVIWY